ncbi:MAG: hypothetical protein ABII01_07555 [Candidatus Woesearchaeota archaeon]
MVNKVLVAFIKQNLEKRYDIYTIKAHLMQSGYSDKDIQDAIEYVYNPPTRHEIHLSKPAIIVVVVLAILMTVSAFFIFRGGPEPGELLDISLKSRSEKSILPGEKFSFQYDITNTGSTRRYDIMMEFQLVHRETEQIIDSYEKTIAVETSKSGVEEFDIPATAPLGAYFVKATAKYKKEEAKASLSINVIEETAEETCFDGVKNQDEEGIDCGGICQECETCFDNIKNQDEENVDCGGSCSPCASETTTTTSTTQVYRPPTGGGDDRPSWEILDEIKEISLADPDKAAKECLKQTTDIKDKCFLNLVQVTGSRRSCEQISDSNKKDSCFLFAATITVSSNICEEIVKDSIRDQCYMGFILEHEQYELCDKLTNIYEKRACEGLRMARTRSS